MNPKPARSFLFALLRDPVNRKYIFRWWRSFAPEFMLRQACPWIAFGAIDFIRQHLKPGQRVFEWGSGGSTLFWLSQGLSVVSIEHDSRWFERMQDHFLDRKKLDYRLIESDMPAAAESQVPTDDSNAANPAEYRSLDAAHLERRFYRYAQCIDEFPDQHFDWILVDGRARPSCMVHALPKLKPGGYLILDNSDRAYYLRKTQQHLGRLTMHDFRGPCPAANWHVRTTLWGGNQ